jgi:hypothetical protein
MSGKLPPLKQDQLQIHHVRSGGAGLEMTAFTSEYIILLKEGIGVMVRE